MFHPSVPLQGVCRPKPQGVRQVCARRGQKVADMRQVLSTNINIPMISSHHTWPPSISYSSNDEDPRHEYTLVSCHRTVTGPPFVDISQARVLHSPGLSTPPHRQNNKTRDLLSNWPSLNRDINRIQRSSRPQFCPATALTSIDQRQNVQILQNISRLRLPTPRQRQLLPARALPHHRPTPRRRSQHPHGRPAPSGRPAARQVTVEEHGAVLGLLRRQPDRKPAHGGCVSVL